MPPSRRSRREPRKVQTRLSFEPTSPGRHKPSGISPARVICQDPRLPVSKEPSSSARSRPHFTDEDVDDEIFAGGKKFAVVIPSSSPISDDTGRVRGKSFMATTTSSSIKKRKKPNNLHVYSTDSESSDEEVITKLSEEAKKRLDFLSDESESSPKSSPWASVKDGVVNAAKKSNLDANAQTPKKKKISARSLISGGYLAPKPSISPKVRDRTGNDKSISPKLKNAKTVTISSGEDQKSDEIVAVNRSVQKRLTPKLQMKAGINKREDISQRGQKRRRSMSSDDDDDPIRSSPIKRRKPVLHEEDSSDESDSGIPLPSQRPKVTPARGKQAASNVKTSKTKHNNDNSKRLTRQSDTPKRHRTDKQKKLELLRRRRAGERIDELTESSSDEEAKKGAYDTDSSHAALSVFDDEESEGGIEDVRQSLRPGVRNQDDDSFVVDDDDEPLGAPPHGMLEIPLEFTHHAHKPLKEHFKDVVEWMVQKKINPSFNRNDAIYVQAFRKLEPEARGLANSKFISSTWSKDFVRSLWARPEFHEEDISAGDEGEGRKCDACGRSGHPAKFRVQLRGKPYYESTLEEVGGDDESDEDDGSSSDSASVNSKGQRILSEDKEFYLGRFCRSNAERAHSLIHWKHALNEWVVQTLEQQGFLKAERLAERIKWSQRKLNSYANQIVDEWVENGEVKGLYRDFKNNIEAARIDKQDRWNA